MAFSQAQLDALREAYALGVTRVTADGRTVEYASRAELRRTISEMEAALGVSSSTPAPTVGYASFGRT